MNLILLNTFIGNLEHGTSRAENIIASSNSKLTSKRTFKGFLVNCISPLDAKINGLNFVIKPHEGTYTYIHDFNRFVISPETLIVGIENPENFRFIRKQMHLFNTEQILFVSRYPQSKDLITWLKSVPNKYLHFGDFDFEGIRIFKDEYFQFLQKKASFFIPENIEELIVNFGNKNLYDKQYRTHTSSKLVLNEELSWLIGLFHKHKKCLEQEVLIQY